VVETSSLWPSLLGSQWGEGGGLVASRFRSPLSVSSESHRLPMSSESMSSESMSSESMSSESMSSEEQGLLPISPLLSDSFHFTLEELDMISTQAKEYGPEWLVSQFYTGGGKEYLANLASPGAENHFEARKNPKRHRRSGGPD
jgi:hypothetical protein